MLAGLPLALEPGAPAVAAPEVVSPTRGACLAPSCRPGHAHLAGVGTCLRAAAPHEAPPEAPRSPAPGLLESWPRPCWGHRGWLGLPPSAHEPASLRGTLLDGTASSDPGVSALSCCRKALSKTLFSLVDGSRGGPVCRQLPPRSQKGREGNFNIKYKSPGFDQHTIFTERRP